MVIITNLLLFLIIAISFILSPILALSLFAYTFICIRLVRTDLRVWVSVTTAVSGLAFGVLHFRGINLLLYVWHNNLRLLTPFGEDKFYYVVTNQNLTVYDTFVMLGAYSILLTLALLIKRLLWYKHYHSELVDASTAGVNLGCYSDDSPAILTHHELNQHMLVVGTTGSGKTSTLLNLVHECCRQNLPLVYLDGKGSRKLADQIAIICKRYGRTLKVFTVDPVTDIPGLSGYNPFAFGNFTEWKNKVVTLLGESSNKGQEHYATQEQSYINLACEILDKSQTKIDLEGMLAYLSHPEELQKLANKLDHFIARRFVESMPKKGETNDLIKILELFYHSHYGQLFSTTKKPDSQVINLQQSLENKEIVLFLFDAASYKRDTALLGKLVINDINTAFASFGRHGKKVDAYAVFDEFAAYASPNMASILALQRSNGLHAIVGTQSIHAISMESQDIKRIAVELIANCNTFIVHKLNDSHDIELLSKTIGSEKRYVASSISENTDGERVTVSLKDEYRLDGEAIRGLKPGYGYLCRTVVNSTPQLVKFNFL